MRIAIVVSLVISTVAIIFAVINPLAVDINFVFFTIVGASLPLVLISTLILGVVIGYLGWLPARVSARRKIKALERAAGQSATIGPVGGEEEWREIPRGTDEGLG